MPICIPAGRSPCADFFIDAANADFSVLRHSYHIPGRMLLLGLPLTILFGFVIGAVLFEQITLIEAAILATMLSATDAALGKAVITNPQVLSQRLLTDKERNRRNLLPA